MADLNLIPRVFGPATVAVDYGSGYTSFGYTDNGVRETTQGFAQEIHSDDGGGDAGPPVDIQYLGETGRISLSMTKWSTTVEQTLRGRVKGFTAGNHPAGSAGTLLMAGTLYFKLKYTGTAVNGVAIQSREWPCVVLVRTPIEINKGTIYSRLVMEFEAFKHPTSGVLYTTTNA